MQHLVLNKITQGDDRSPSPFYKRKSLRPHLLPQHVSNVLNKHKQFSHNNKTCPNKERLRWKKGLIAVKREGSDGTIATPQASTGFLCLYCDKLSQPRWGGVFCFFFGWGGGLVTTKWPTFGKSIWRSSINVCLKKGGQEAFMPLASGPIYTAHLVINGSSRKPSLQYCNTWQPTMRCQSSTAQENEAGQNEIPKH